jgi:hypothetical protein
MQTRDPWRNNNKNPPCVQHLSVIHDKLGLLNWPCLYIIFLSAVFMLLLGLFPALWPVYASRSPAHPGGHLGGGGTLPCCTLVCPATRTNHHQRQCQGTGDTSPGYCVIHKKQLACDRLLGWRTYFMANFALIRYIVFLTLYTGCTINLLFITDTR